MPHRKEIPPTWEEVITNTPRQDRYLTWYKQGKTWEDIAVLDGCSLCAVRDVFKSMRRKEKRRMNWKLQRLAKRYSGAKSPPHDTP